MKLISQECTAAESSLEAFNDGVSIRNQSRCIRLGSSPQETREVSENCIVTKTYRSSVDRL